MVKVIKEIINFTQRLVQILSQSGIDSERDISEDSEDLREILG